MIGLDKSIYVSSKKLSVIFFNYKALKSSNGRKEWFNVV